MAEPWVELRVHGVSGTPPESMLDFDRVAQVAGDEFGRQFRRYDEHGVELPGDDGQVVEAYHWGKFTSGSWTKALWLLLAPFGIVNAAQFTLEPPTSRRARRAHAVAGAMLRLIGLTLTGLFVVDAAVIGMDLWAWQRIGDNDTFPFKFAVAIGVAVPLAVVAFLIFFGRARLSGSQDAVRGNPYELVPRGTGDRPRRGGDRPGGGEERRSSFWERELPTDLTRERFFDGDPDVPALRRLHAAGGLALIAALGFAPGRETDGWAEAGLWAAIALAALVVAVVVVLGDPEGSATVRWPPRDRGGRGPALHAAAGWIAGAFAVVGGALTVGAVAHLLAKPPQRSAEISNYPHIDHASFVIMALAGLGMIVLATANIVLAAAERSPAARAHRPVETPRPFRPYARGMACTLLASLGIFLGVGFAGAYSVTAARVLGSVQAPEILQRVVYGWGITALVLLAIFGYALAQRRRARATLQGRVLRDFERTGSRLPERWVARVAGAIWAARLKNGLVCVLTVFTLTGVVLTIASAIELAPIWTSGRSINLGYGIGWLGASTGGGSEVAGLLVWLGGAALTGLAAGLVFLGRSAILAESTRRGVNVLWDVIAFWPRAAHPLVPPAYSQRSVADIRRRIAWHLDVLRDEPGGEPNPRPADHVVLCGHSQGSLLSFAALVSMHESDELDRVGLLTFGSQLQVMFSRGFPAYVNYPSIRWIFRRLDGRWRNLYRDTDHLAGPVLSWNHDASDSTADWIDDPATPPLPDLPATVRQYGPELRLLDPPPPDVLLQERPLAELRRHSEYWKDREAWAIGVAAVCPRS